MKTGIELIAEERREQIEKHGRTVESDVANNKKNQLIDAAAALLTVKGPRGMQFSKPQGWDLAVWNKMSRKPYKESLVIAGALIAAEIDRLNAES